MKPSNLTDWRRIDGWLYPEEADWLYEQVKALPDGAIIVEIGAWMGRSTCALAVACTGTANRVFTIDTFKGSREHQPVPPNLRQQLEANLERLGVAKYVTVIQDKSLAVARDWKWSEPYIDLVFLDGNHDDTAADIRAWRPHVRGIFAVHDAAGDGAWENVRWDVAEQFKGLERGECCSIAYFDLGGNDDKG